MVKYIKSNSNTTYIGGDLYDLDWESPDIDAIQEQRAIEIYEFIENCSDYYVCYFPENTYGKYLIMKSDAWEITDLFNSLAIKDGVNVKYVDKHIEIIAYYNGHQETVYLYPVLERNAKKVMELIDEQDYDSYELEDKLIKSYFNL